MGRGRLAAVGFLSMAGQVALLRELSVASFGVELILLLGLGLWLAGGAAGALLGGNTGKGGSGPDRGVLLGFLLLALLLPLEAGFLRGSRLLLGGVPGAFLPLWHQGAAALLGVVPAAAALGWLFARAARSSLDQGGTLPRAYAWESAGGAAGSVAATLALAAGFPNLGLLLGVAAVSAAVAAFPRPGARSFSLFRLSALVLLLLLLAMLAAVRPLDLASSRWNHAGLVAVADTPRGRTAVARFGEQVVLFGNDALLYESEGTAEEEFVALAALQVRPGARVLVLGSGAAGVVQEALRHTPSSVEDIEGDEAFYRAVVPHLPHGSREALTHPSVRVVFDDPRRFLARARGERWDLILVAAGEPSSGESNRFYTREFFALCAVRLAPGGVVALRLPSAENLWTPLLAQRNAAVHAALRLSFPSTLVVPGAADTLLGSGAPLATDQEELGRRLRERGAEGRLVTPPHLRFLLTSDRMARAQERLAQAAQPPNTDARPVCYQQAVLLWLERFVPPGTIPGVLGARWGAIALAALVLLLALSLRRPHWRGAALAGVAGFAGMAIESVVLLRFQAETGSLYRDIGLLLAGVMAGMAAGALAWGRLAAGGCPTRGWGAGLLIALAALAGGVALGSGSGALFRLLPAAATLGVGGALAGALFSHAGSLFREGSARAAGTLYAADLLGGVAGALLAGLLLLPLLGASATAAGVAALSLAGLLAL